MTAALTPDFLPKHTALESFTYPFFRRDEQANPATLAQAYMAVPDDHPGKGLRALYLHFPFCETICRFCPFIKSRGSDDRISNYLKAIHREIEQVARTTRASSWKIDSIYIGGGTPSVMSDDQAVRLLEALHANFDIKPRAEISFEVEAKSAQPSLLHALQAHGVTRISFGIQTLDPEIRRNANLTATQDQIQQTLDVGGELFAEVNADMIAGFPGQTRAQALDDLGLAASLGATSMSFYPMDYATVLPSYLNQMRSGKLPRPAEVGERWNMFHEGRKLLLETYEQQNMYCFGQPGMKPCRYMFEVLYGTYDDQYIGLGCGAYTGLKGAQFQNSMSEQDYVDSMAEGASPVRLCSPWHTLEKEFVYFGKRLHANLANADELGLRPFLEPRVSALLESGLITRNGDIIRLTAEGERAYHRIMVAFMDQQQRNLYDKASARLCEDLGLMPNGDLADTAARVKGMGAEIALGQERGHA